MVVLPHIPFQRSFLDPFWLNATAYFLSKICTLAGVLFLTSTHLPNLEDKSTSKAVEIT